MLRRAALTHLARYATTQAGLLRVLDRRVDRWARRAEAEGIEAGPALGQARVDCRQVVRTLTEAGVLDDRAYAEARARRLTRAGRSRVAVAAHLAAKGVAPELSRDALPDDAAELKAAVLYARRRRLGPFRTPPDPLLRNKELAAMARAGFAQASAHRALGMDTDAAMAMIDRVRRGE